MYDLIIIGGGPAGITAGIYAARQKIKTLLITENFGGQANDAFKIDNYPGLPSLAGLELIKKFTEHLKKFNIDIKEGIKVQKVKPKAKLGFDKSVETKFRQTFEIVTARGESFQGKSIIVATGKKPKQLAAKNIEKFAKRGVSYCATCDAPLFADKIVAVAGGGDHGLNTAYQLLQYAKKIYIFEIADKLLANNLLLLDKVRASDKVEVITQAKITQVNGTNFLKSLSFENIKTGQVKKIDVGGLFVAIGSSPNSEFVKNLLKLNKEGEIEIDLRTNATSVPGIFAAGDVTDIPQKQIIIAAGEGAKAALGVYKYLKHQRPE